MFAVGYINFKALEISVVAYKADNVKSTLYREQIYKILI